MDSTSMLRLIVDSPIVSTDTLRPDHLCAALISEADRLGIELDRDLWQPAAAIAAHGIRGICLELPPRLQEISSDIISELIDCLNWHAPGGCYLGTAEGDGACLIWRISQQASVDAINSDPNSRWEAMLLEVPEHWLSAIVNGDESSFDYYDDPADYEAYQQFCRENVDGWTVSGWDEESEFSSDHDASAYGVLACNVVPRTLIRLKPAMAAA